MLKVNKKIHEGFVVEIENFVDEVFCKNAIEYLSLNNSSCLKHSHKDHANSLDAINFSENSFQWSGDCLFDDSGLADEKGFGFRNFLVLSKKIKPIVDELASGDLYNVRIAFHRYVAESWGPEHADLHPYASILYLNDDYDGGELYFTKKDFTIRPAAKSLYLFRGIGQNTHKVNQIKNNDRYAIVFFWRHKDDAKNREDELKYDN